MSYLLFVYDDYYPLGGWEDLVDIYEDLESAIRNIPLYSNFDVVEVDWASQVFKVVNVEENVFFKQLNAEEIARREESIRKANEYRLESIKDRMARERAALAEREIGPEATNAFVEFLGVDR